MKTARKKRQMREICANAWEKKVTNCLHTKIRTDIKSKR
jgi:hypothetical protein